MSIENMGRPNSYAWYGPGWAHVSSTPFRLSKGFTTSGGLMSPTIISMPGQIEAGSRSAAYANNLDLPATFLDLAGVDYLRQEDAVMVEILQLIQELSFHGPSPGSHPGPNTGILPIISDHMNSGAEAVGSAVKVVRNWGYQVKGAPEDKAQIIVCKNNFRGRTLSIVSFSTDVTARADFGPFTPGFVVVPFGDADAMEQAISEKTVAVLVEPIQAEAGVIIPPDGYLKRVTEICTRHNITMILDEIQTGLGRTGKLLAEQHDGVKADVSLVGKALSGGFYPISAVLAPTEVLDVLKPSEHGSTFGGNPLACAIAREALKVLLEEGLVENSAEIGEYFKERLAAINSELIYEVRGKSLMLAVELRKEAGGARKFCEALKDRGILCKETHDHIIRFSPPLVLTVEQVDWAMEQIEQVFSQSTTH